MKKIKNISLFYIVLLSLLLVTFVLSLTLGAEHISIFNALSNKTSVDYRILLYARLPRSLAAILAGSALALSGAIIQSVLNNSLASPSTIGVNSGAGLAVAIFSAFFPSSLIFTPFAALIGAFGGALLVLAIGEKASSSRLSLVLAGVAVTAVFSAGIDCVLTFVPDALNGYSDFRIGGLFNISMKDLFPSSILIIIASVIALLLHNEMDILLLGLEQAQTLGLKAKPLRLIFLALSAILAGSAISFTGLIGFVGLIVPHIMREMVGEESKKLMASSLIGGALLLLLSDLLSRIIFAPFELPVGIVMALLGGPFFIYLLRKRGRNHD